MTPAILYTCHEGSVAICHPAETCLAAMSSGGYWAHKPRGYLEIQIERQIESGIRPDAARRFARALHFGGCTTAEALEIIRDRDCGHLGTAHELWGVGDLPDRWFRDAWRRSHNGGPIGIDMPKARKVQLKRISSLSRKRGVTLELPRWRERVRRASTPEDLRHVWPDIQHIGS